MAGFTVPNFNLVCNVFTGPYLTRVLRQPNQPCNLQGGRRSRVFSSGLFDPIVNFNNWGPTFLLCPPGTDIRHRVLVPDPDLVEVPAGSGRWYCVVFVDDVGKGFANEFRAAELAQISSLVDPVSFAGLSWPIPMP